MDILVVEGENGGVLLLSVAPLSPPVVMITLEHDLGDSVLDTFIIPVSVLVALGVGNAPKS